MTAQSRPREPRSSAALGALVFVLALNIRPAVSALGPLVPMIHDQEGMTEGALGILGAVPLIAFAVVSPLAYLPSRRWGMDRTLFVALAIMAAGIGLRSGAGTPGLWLGTLVLGVAAAVFNVLAPTVVRRDYPRRLSAATGVYSACMTIGAAIATAVVVPIAQAWGWRIAMALWAVPVVALAAAWIPRATRPRADLSEAESALPERNVWRSWKAWMLTANMSLRAFTFYVATTWMPTIEVAYGFSEAEASLHLTAFSIVGIAGSLLFPVLQNHTRTQAPAGIWCGMPMALGALGLIVFPDAALLWMLVAGFGAGASVTVALSLLSMVGRDALETARLSGMSQSFGHVVAALGPIAAGFLGQATGSWTPTLVMLIAASGLQAVVGGLVGKGIVARDAGRNHP